jgi:hypothetical protein
VSSQRLQTMQPEAIQTRRTGVVDGVGAMGHPFIRMPEAGGCEGPACLL